MLIDARTRIGVRLAATLLTAFLIDPLMMGRPRWPWL
jgi:hypothetical protein